MATSRAHSPKKGVCAIVGVGPKLGRSIARKFAMEGHTIAILARDLVMASSGRLSAYADELAREAKSQVFAIRIDCSESKSIHEAFEAVLSLGFVEVLIYNAHNPIPWNPTPFVDISLERFEKTMAVASSGAFNCAQKVLPKMMEKGRGTILFTGCTASVDGIVGYADLCAGKFALRGMAQSLAKEYQPMGVHVAHVIIDGIIGTPMSVHTLNSLVKILMSPPKTTTPPVSSRSIRQRPAPHQASTSRQNEPEESSSSSSSVGDQQVKRGGVGPGLMDPDVLAQTYWLLHTQDRSVWTQEINLCPGGPIFY